MKGTRILSVVHGRFASEERRVNTRLLMGDHSDSNFSLYASRTGLVSRQISSKPKSRLCRISWKRSTIPPFVDSASGPPSGLLFIRPVANSYHSRSDGKGLSF